VTIKEAILATIADTLEKLRDGLVDLLFARREGWGGFVFTEEQSIFISGNETGATGSEEIQFGNFTVFGDDTYYADIVDGEPDSIIEIEEESVYIQLHRGTLNGIFQDIHRLCHTDNIALTLHDQLECGWLLGVTSPGFDETGNYVPEYALTYLNLDNMLDIVTENQSIRKDSDVKKIISKYFIPIHFNKRFFLNPIDGAGFGGIGVTPAGGLGESTP